MKPATLATATLATAALSALQPFNPSAHCSDAPRPNIVLILTDDMGYSDLGCFGGEIRTPNIDSLAKNGIAFTQFYNQARCCPTRATLLTGRYPHQAGMGEMIDAYAKGARDNAASRAYTDRLSPDTPTMAEVLRTAGYSTMMAGKWHLGARPAEWPVKRGFDRSFALIGGAMNYYGGDSGDEPRTPMAIDDAKWSPPRDGFYSTDAFTDHAIEYMTHAVKNTPGKPFFLYLPYNAAHWPLQVDLAEIDAYKGHYDAGWQPTREKRLARLKQLGIVPQNQQMTPMDTGNTPAWDKLTPAERAKWARLMEAYAAVVTHMDTQIGRLLATLDQLGIADNTIVLFLHDNGGADEAQNKDKPGSTVGDRDSYPAYDVPWATVSNTPWRRHKTTCYEGGISTPLLVRWPAGIDPAKNGTYVRTPAHIIDLLPTFTALAGATYPATAAIKLEGRDITPMLKGAPGPADRTYCWEHEGFRGIRSGKWKLVSAPPTKRQRNITGPWELYDLETDRAEQNNLAKQNPDLVKKLAAEYNAWATRCGVIEFAKITNDGKPGAAKNKGNKAKN